MKPLNNPQKLAKTVCKRVMSCLAILMVDFIGVVGSSYWPPDVNLNIAIGAKFSNTIKYNLVGFILFYVMFI